MTAPSSLKVDDALRAEVWLAHEALKPICDDLSQHRVRYAYMSYILAE